MCRDDDENTKLIPTDEELILAYRPPTATLEDLPDVPAEDFYRALFEQMNQGVVAQNAAGQIILANATAQRILGIPFELMHGKTSSDFSWRVIREDGSPFPGNALPSIVTLRTGVAVSNVVMGVFHPEMQTFRWVIANSFPLSRSDERSPYCVCTMFYEWTREKAERDRLVQAEIFARKRLTVLEALSTAIDDYIVIYDHQGKAIRMGNTLFKLFALDGPSSDAASLPADFYMQLHARDVQNRQLREEQWPAHRILRGEALDSSNAVELLLRGLDGQEHCFVVSGVPLRERDGHIIGAVTFMLEITEHRFLQFRTQNALDALLAMTEAMALEQEAAASWETVPALLEDRASAPENLIARRLAELPCQLLECQRLAITLLDAKNEALYPVVVVGISPEHEELWRHGLQGARLPSLFGDPALLARFYAGEALELDTTRPFLRDQPAYNIVVPIMQGAQVIGVLLLGYGDVQPDLLPYELAIIQAIARLAAFLLAREFAVHERDQARVSLQAANEELEHASKVKGDFLGIMSHEFRTALTGIQGFSEMMRDEDLSLMEMKEFAVDIYSDARRLVRMITDLVDFDRIEAGHLQLNLNWLDLNALILEVVNRLRPTAPLHSLQLHLANALPLLLGDSEKLSATVASLLQNAFQYSPEGGAVEISSETKGHVVHVAVRDHGMGIPAAELERIFERSPQRSMPYIEGGGLNLPLGREIIQRHGGQIWAESVPGKGSTFHFTVQFTGSH